MKALHAMGSDSRMRILALLAGKPFLCVGALSRKTGMSQSAVSQNLRILSESGLVTSVRRGNFIHYMLDREALAGVVDELSSRLGTEPDADCMQCEGRE